MVKINGSSFALQYKRTTSRPIDSTSCFDTIEDARVYARNTDTEVYVPYAGQVISVVENGKCYQLVKDDTVTEYPERQHFKLVVIGNANDIDDAYLSRDKEDTAKELIHFLKGIDAHGESTLEDVTVGGTLKSSDYAKGSSGYSLYKDADGNYHLEIYYLDVRGKMNVETIEVKQSYHVKGAQWMTKASLIVSRVEGDTVYFNTRDAEGNAITNDFVAGDFAYCKTFNLRENRMYWRDVTAVGADYITLGAGITDTIRPGDSIVQLGHATDAARQGATCLDTDSIKIYMGINTKSLPQPLIDLDPVNGAVIKAKLINEATGNDMSDDIGMLDAKIETVKAQTDRMYVIWFEDYVPTLANLPASGWTTDTEKAEHLEDMFYNTSRTAGQGGRAYRFVLENGAYQWKEITDKDTIAALEQSAAAQHTADRKKQVFVARPTAAQEYDAGDIWVNATYSDASVSYDNDELVCITPKAAGAPFAIAHWKPTSTATTAVIRNLGNRITQVVSGLADTDKAVAEAERLAEQGIDDAYDAYRKAQEALGIAENADSAAYANSTVIQQTKDSITALANRISFDSNGNISNINTSGLVTTADFAALTGKEIVYDKDGHVDMTKTAGLVTTANFAQMFSERVEADGYVTKSYIATFMTELPDGRFQSNAIVDADLIRFNGNIVANDTFVVDTEGNLTMNNITAKNLTLSGDIKGNNATLNDITLNNITANSGTFNGIVNADRGSIGGFKISGNGLTNDPFTNDAYVIFRNDYYKCFAGIGGNVLPSTSGMRAVGRFENEDTHDQWKIGRNIALLLSAKNGVYNHAFCGEGNGTLNGWIGGYKYSKFNLTSANTIYNGYSNLKDNNRWIIHSSADGSGVTLPRLPEVRDALGIGSDTKFCVEFTILADLDSKTFDIYGRNGKKDSSGGYPWKASEYPNLVHWNNDHWDSVTMYAGDSLTVLLIYDSGKSGSKGGYPLTYTARVINRQD